MQDSIFIAAPQGTSWPLALETFGTRFEQQWPEARIFPPERGGASNEDYINFQVTLDGQLRTGSYFDRSTLILRDGPPQVWAETITWFLRLLPAGTPAVAMCESNPEEVRPIPANSDTETIRRLLEALANGGY